MTYSFTSLSFCILFLISVFFIISFLYFIWSNLDGTHPDFLSLLLFCIFTFFLTVYPVWCNMSFLGPCAIKNHSTNHYTTCKNKYIRHYLFVFLKNRNTFFAKNCMSIDTMFTGILY